MERVDLIPLFLAAKTKEELVKAMLLNNAKRGKHLNYFQINKINGEWIAWFYDLAKNIEVPNGSR